MNELKHRKLANTLPKLNRELSWLAFNERVLFEALDTRVPVLERLRFLGIYSNNLDEFFRVRVGTLNRLIGARTYTNLGYNPKSIMAQIHQKLKEDEKIFQDAYDDIQSELVDYGIEFLSDKKISVKERNWCKNHFVKQIRGGIAPLLFREDLKFPVLKDKSIYLAIKLELKNSKIVYSLIEVPTEFFPRFIVVPSDNKKAHKVILLEDLIRINLQAIYKVFDLKKVSAYTVKLTRDAELTLDSDFSKKDINYLSESLNQRKKGAPVRFIADKEIPQDLLQFLVRKTRISKQNIVLGGRYHNFKDFMKFPSFGISKLLYKYPEPILNKEFEKSKTILSAIDKQDVVLLYPYNSFDYLLDFLRESSIHPNVIEIKMSLYRLSKKSQIVNILSNAVKNGKRVTVVMEITARFDEANNIFWSEQMKEEGIDVIYGHPELKVHSKLVYVKKKLKNTVTEYVNISTGNFNEVTADIYSDIALFSSNKKLCSEVANVFKFLKGEKAPQFNHLLVAPFNMRAKLLHLIEAEIDHKKSGKKAHIIFKVNSLVDDEIIDKLYEAHAAGVKVELIVRGICCLATVPSSKGEIFSVSIIDRYLEHSRVYYFHNGGNQLCYISSADMMLRNLDFRLEVAAPTYDKRNIAKILKFLQIQLSDNMKARYHNMNMSNARKTSQDEKKLRSQEEIYRWLGERG